MTDGDRFRDPQPNIGLRRVRDLEGGMDIVGKLKEKARLCGN